MNREQIQHISQQRSFPSVSVFLPTESVDERQRQTPQRLLHLLYPIREQLIALEAKQVLAQIDAAIASIGKVQHHKGLIIYANERSHLILNVDFDIPEYATIDNKYITRFLWHGITQTPSYHALMLDMHHTRLFTGHDGNLTEITSSGFPFSVSYEVFSDRAHQAVWVGDRDAAYRDAFKVHILQRLDGLLKTIPQAPIVLIGTEKNRHLFMEHSSHAQAVIADVSGDFAKEPIHTAAPHIAQAIQEWLGKQQKNDALALTEVIGAAHCAYGIKDVWYKTAAGLVHTLYIEPDYELFGTIDPEDPAKIVIYEQRAPQTIDLIDHLIDQVIATNGKVVMLKHPELKIHHAIGQLRD